MTTRFKTFLFRWYDILSYPATLLAALQLRTLRRYGLVHFPHGKNLMLRLGVFPIRRHFYEPHFHPGDLTTKFNLPRELPGIELRDEAQLAFLSEFSFQDELRKFLNPDVPVLENGQVFNIDNVAFIDADIDFYYSIIRLKKPKKLIEIGSGCSTIVALAAIEQNRREDPAYRCELISVEPYPWFFHPSVTGIQQKVEDVPDGIFKSLGENDILFIDSSHMIRPEGDVVYEYLNILPKLAAGVYIHIHDIFTPYNYPELWVSEMHFFWNEQYLVEALLSETRAYEIVGALHYLSRDYPEQAQAAMPLLRTGKFGQSLWIRKT